MRKKFVKPTNIKKAGLAQPTRNDSTRKGKSVETKNKTETKKRIYKSQAITPTKEKTIKEGFIRRNDTPKERKHPEYGTSNLELKFEKEFLKKLGVKYVKQFKAESIGRYYDFYLTDCNVIIEINGGYWHSDPRLYESKDLNPTQKHNIRVDKDKEKWAKEHKIPLLKIWEKDIHEAPKKVMEQLQKDIVFYKEKYDKEIKLKERPKK